jgi:hypothetical protein
MPYYLIFHYIYVKGEEEIYLYEYSSSTAEFELT